MKQFLKRCGGGAVHLNVPFRGPESWGQGSHGAQRSAEPRHAEDGRRVLGVLSPEQAGKFMNDGMRAFLAGSRLPPGELQHEITRLRTDAHVYGSLELGNDVRSRSRQAW